MDFTGYLQFTANNLLFSFVIISLSFILGWLLYNKVILRNICLKDALFEKDNLAAWVEFIGAFVFPALYLSAKAVEGSASDTLLVDLVVCVIYAIAYIFLFTLLRLVSGGLVAAVRLEDHEGRVSLNSEIYKQKNISAAIFSVVLSSIFVNLVQFFSVEPGYLSVSLLRMLVILVFTLVAFAVYMQLLRSRTTLFKEIFIDNNIAASAALLGFQYAVNLILSNIVTLQVEFNLGELVLMSLTSLILFGLLAVVFKYLMSRLIKVDIWNEVYEQNSMGAALGQAALYIGIANVIIHFIK